MNATVRPVLARHFEVQALRADFDKDSEVDGLNEGNADRDGDVDGKQFLIWQLEFVAGAGTNAGGDAAPPANRPKWSAYRARLDPTLPRGRGEIAINQPSVTVPRVLRPIAVCTGGRERRRALSERRFRAADGSFARHD